MKELRCLVVDDEPLATDVVVNYLQRLDIHAITRCDNGIEAFRQLQQHRFDLLFLDIEMPQLTGFDLLKSLTQRPLVIITTAYRDYAVEGFEWEVLDYLVKPFSFTRFLQTMEKAIRTMQQTGSVAAGQTNVPPGNLNDSGSLPPGDASAADTPSGNANTNSPPAPADEKGFLFLKADRQWIRVDLSGILYIESLKDYIRMVTTAGEYLCHQSLADITARLSPEKFLRVHRSYTVALDKIDQVKHHCAHIRGKAIPISRANRQEVYQRLGQ